LEIGFHCVYAWTNNFVFHNIYEYNILQYTHIWRIDGDLRLFDVCVSRRIFRAVKYTYKQVSDKPFEIKWATDFGRIIFKCVMEKKCINKLLDTFFTNIY
jgi:hypothetical protein